MLQLSALFWPSRDSKQIKAAIAKELQAGVIQQLPLSANMANPTPFLTPLNGRDKPDINVPIFKMQYVA